MTTEPVVLRPLQHDDIPAAQRLRAQAGWNQADDDWHRLLGWSPAGCWAAERAGQVLGTTAVAVYGRRIAWIGMVLVDEAHRRRGIGQRLLGAALAYLDGLGVQTIALDATPAGQPLYERLGFALVSELARWRGPLPTGELLADQREHLPVGWRPPATVRRFMPADLPAVVAYDAGLFGVERAHILGGLLAGYPSGCFLAEQAGRPVGFVLSRPGAGAWHLGPLAADDPSTARSLVREAFGAVPTLPDGRPLPSEVVMDVMSENRHALALAAGCGLAPVRPFLRMTRGAPPPRVTGERLYTSAGPELG